MANVLPIQTQRTVWGDYRSRAVLIGSLALFVTAGLTFLALLPSYVVLAGAESAPETPLPKVEGGQADVQGVLRVQSLLTTVFPIVTATTSPTTMVREVLASRPQGVRIERISYLPAGNGTIVLTGTGSTREAINAYRAALSENDHFGEISVPLGALVGVEGGKFTITIAGISL